MKNSAHSYIYAPEPQQANYILRSFLITLKMGFQKAFLFMGRDPNSTNTLQYSSSGIISDQNTGLAKKPSYYYLATMQKILGNASLNEIVSYRKMVNGKEVYCFEFQNKSNERIYALWTREKDSETDSGISLQYELDLDYTPQYAYTVFPKDKYINGEKVDLVITGSSLGLTLTETPQFLVVSQTKTAINDVKTDEMDFKVYPNPSNDSVTISFSNPVFQHVKIAVYSVDGKFIEVLANQELKADKHYFSFGENAGEGVYFIHLQTNTFKKVEKLMIR